MVIALIVLILSIVAIISPYTSWYLSIGWKFRDAEPSDLALSMNRIIGIVVAVVSIIIIVSSISNSISVNNWPKEFTDRLESDDVESVVLNTGIDENIQVDLDEAKNIAKIIKKVNMSKGKRKGTYGYSEAIVVDFKEFYKVTIYSIGDRFTIELKGLDVEYSFQSEELEKWVSNNLEK